MSLRRLPIAVLSLAALALVIAGCGGSSSSSSSPSEATSASAPSGSAEATTIAASESEGIGTVLVDAKGFTVYSFGKDSGTTSTCEGACAEAWPPVIATGKPAAGDGASADELGTTKRKDGTLQVTYAGHPLYTFIEDKSPGEANGNGATAFGGEWTALDASGGAVVATEAEAESGSEESSESSGGYGY